VVVDALAPVSRGFALICPGKSGHGILLRRESKNEAEAI
jgi:hypothetical protein